MDEEQAALQQFTLTMVQFSNDYALSDFKTRSSTALKTLNNYSIIMTNNGEYKTISRVVSLSMLLNSELIRLAVLVNFMLFLNILKISKISFRTLKGTLAITCLVGACYLKIV